MDVEKTLNENELQIVKLTITHILTQNERCTLRQRRFTFRSRSSAKKGQFFSFFQFFRLSSPCAHRL